MSDYFDEDLPSLERILDDIAGDDAVSSLNDYQRSLQQAFEELDGEVENDDGTN